MGEKFICNGDAEANKDFLFLFRKQLKKRRGLASNFLSLSCYERYLGRKASQGRGNPKRPQTDETNKKPLSKQWSEAIFEKEDSVIKINYWI